MGAMIGLALLLSYLPMVSYALFIWWLDRYEKEPLRLASTAFLWGTLPAILIARMAEVALEPPLEEELERDLISSGLIAPLAEETAKGLFLALLFLRRRDEIDSLYDGFLYGSLVGFGFAATENVFYLIGAGIEGGTAAMLALASLRAGIFGLNHAFFTGFTGLGLAMARLSPRGFRRLWAPLVGWSAGVGFHAFHNGVLTLVSHLGDEGSVLVGCLTVIAGDWMGALLVFALGLWGLYRERLWITWYLGKEVERGTLPPAVYQECRSAWRRGFRRWGALLRGDWQEWKRLGDLYGAAIELAFRQHQRLALGEQRWEKEIARLRERIRALTAPSRIGDP
jgi:RsiW-degrading membrane proteinase PrsW (M82 family)